MYNRALFWDFDGTLIYPNESFAVALQHIMQSYNYKVTMEDARSFLHSTVSWYFPDITYEKRTGEKWWEDLFNKFDFFYERYSVGQYNKKSINYCFKEYVLQSDHYKLYEDTKECLLECKRRGYNNYIVSNNFPELVEPISKLEMKEFFSDFILSTNIGYEKPRLEIFKFALERAGNPSICYMIGDNPVADIEGGNNAGLRTILVHKKKSKLTRADYVCETLLDILSIL